MNCPSHYLLYSAAKHSYRELPLRLATFDMLHRNEVSGALSGLTTRASVPAGRLPHLPDGESDRRRGEAAGRLHHRLLQHVRFKAELRFCTRPPVRVGDDAMWDRAEAGLKAALEATRLPYQTSLGDGAFYGPKIDFHVADSIGRRAAGDDSARLLRRRSGSASSTSARTMPSTGRW